MGILMGIYGGLIGSNGFKRLRNYGKSPCY